MYQDLEAQLHDVFWSEEENANEMPLLRDFLIQRPGRSLEVGCGSGRLLLQLLPEFNIEGSEISADMVSLLKNEAQKQQLSPVIHQGDILATKLPNRYNSITIPAFTLQLFNRSEAHKLLMMLRSATADSGALYISVFIPWSEIIDELEQGTWHLDKSSQLKDGSVATCETRHQIDRVNQTLDRQHRYQLKHPNRKAQTHRSSQHLQWYLLPELKLLLSNCGWVYQTHHTDFILGTQDPDASILTITAEAANQGTRL